jgi:hypothetical protein
MNAIDPQEFGRLQAQVEGLRRDTDRQTATLDRLEKRLATIDEKLSQASGGWKMLMGLGTLASVAGGALSWMLTHVAFRTPT